MNVWLWLFYGRDHKSCCHYRRYQICPGANGTPNQDRESMTEDVKEDIVREEDVEEQKTNNTIF